MTGLILNDRFWSKVRDDPTGCWLWTGAIALNGYGQWAANGVTKSTHRLAWRELRGEIPDGLHIDHLCMVRNCVNPWHMELVSSKVNTRRRFTADLFCHLPPGTTAPWNRRETVREAQERQRQAEADVRFAAFLALSPEEQLADFRARFGFRAAAS